MADLDDLSTKDDTKVDPPEGDTDTSSKQTVDPAIEAEARKMGWRPETEYDGPKDKFVDAATFIENGEKVLPIVNAANRSLRAEVDRLKREGQEFREVLERAHAAEKADLETKLAEAKALRKKAITEGDGEAHEAADEQVTEITETLRKVDAPKKAQPTIRQQLNPTGDPTLGKWLDDHPRMESDPDFVITVNALAAHKKFTPLRDTGRTFYDAVYDAAVELERQVDDGGKGRPGPARGGRGNDNVRGNQGAGQRTYENLDPEFKKTCDRMYRDFGGGKDKAKWNEKYVAGCSDDAFKS